MSIKFFTTIGLCTFSLMPAFCQTEPTIEELRQEILLLKQQTQEVQLHLSRSHREFRTGTIFYAVGIVLAVAAVSAEAGNNNGGGLFLLGTGCMLAGGILYIDSHKHIGRAGISRISTNRVGVRRKE